MPISGSLVVHTRYGIYPSLATYESTPHTSTALQPPTSTLLRGRFTVVSDLCHLRPGGMTWPRFSTARTVHPHHVATAKSLDIGYNASISSKEDSQAVSANGYLSAVVELDPSRRTSPFSLCLREVRLTAMRWTAPKELPPLSL